MSVYEKLCEALGKEKVLRDVLMSGYTTFKTGGAADIFINPCSIEDIKKIFSICREEKYPHYVVGNGSNTLVGDKGIRGAVIHLENNFSNIEVSGTVMKAQSGAKLSAAARKALEKGLKGFEFAAGIPGTAGGGTAMNAGAYGGELKDIIKNVKVLNDGKVMLLSNEDCSFRYRSSRIMDENMLVLETEFQLSEGSPALIKANMEDFNRRRREKQPLNYPSAGSVFKRPEGFFAGKLIEDAGLKGYSIGGAQVSQLHAGFIINKNNASSKDIKDLIEHIQKEVLAKQGVRLETEIKMIGEF